MSLRNKLVVLVLIPLALIFATVIIIQYRSMRTLAMTEAKGHTLLLTQATAGAIEADLARIVHVTHTGAAALESAPELSGDRVWTLLARLVEQVPLVDGASIAYTPEAVIPGMPAAPYVWNANGTIRQEDLAEAYDYTIKNWFTEAVDGNAGWTDPYEGPVFGGLLVSYSVPVIRNDRVEAVISVDIPLLPLQSRLKVGEFSNTSGFLVGSGDRFISNPDPKLIMQPVTTHDGPAMLAEAPPGTLIQMDDWPNQQPHIVAFEPIPTADWMFAAAIEESQVLGPVRAQLTWNVSMLVAGGLLVTCIVLLTGLRLTRDLRMLALGVSKVSGGDLGASIDPMRRHDELGKLALDFNRMTKQLGRTVDRVASEQAARRAMERELDVAREIQEEMLPHEYPMLADHPDVDLHAVNHPARYVAGDFFDYWVRDEVLTIVLADVAGSGMPAALVMVRAMTLLRQFDDPASALTAVVSRTNEALCNDNERQLFVTGVIVRINLATWSYQLVSAGHLPALLGDGEGEVKQEGDSTGPLLGVIPAATWEARQGVLAPGHWLALYTDGITEATDVAGEELGVGRLAEALAELGSVESEVLSEQALSAATMWHGGPVNDDLSAMVLRRPKSA